MSSLKLKGNWLRRRKSNVDEQLGFGLDSCSETANSFTRTRLAVRATPANRRATPFSYRQAVNRRQCRDFSIEVRTRKPT